MGEMSGGKPPRPTNASATSPVGYGGWPPTIRLLSTQPNSLGASTQATRLEQIETRRVSEERYGIRVRVWPCSSFHGDVRLGEYSHAREGCEILTRLRFVLGYAIAWCLVPLLACQQCGMMGKCRVASHPTYERLGGKPATPLSCHVYLGSRGRGQPRCSRGALPGK